jgi:hypothetical protein
MKGQKYRKWIRNGGNEEGGEAQTYYKGDRPVKRSKVTSCRLSHHVLWLQCVLTLHGFTSWNPYSE